MSGSTRQRILAIGSVFVFLFLSAAGRLFYLQIFRGDYYAAKAQNQQSVSGKLPPERGGIFLSVRDGRIPLALTRTWYSVWASPREMVVEERETIAQKLAELMELDPAVVSERLQKDGDPYEPLKDKIDKQVVEELARLNFKGVHWQAVQDRYYPLGDLAASVVGFVGESAEDTEAKSGRYGLEGFYDGILKGEAGYMAGFKKALGSLILPLSNIIKPKKGEDIYLTLDYNIQLAVEEELKRAAEKFSAESASAVVLNPKTGAVLAMASWPSFDPNRYNEVKNASLFLNPTIQLLFEPGSIFKPITMAAALDVNVISPDLTYFDSGEVSVDGHTIRNSTLKAYGTQTMTQVLEKSLNTGAIFAVRRMPPGVWREYVSAFGFGERTGIALAGEVKGDIANLKGRGEIDILTSSFGQGVAVTPLAMANAVAAIANGGELTQPYVVEKITNGDEVIFESDPKMRRRVIKLATSQSLVKMMVNAVENGSGHRAQIPGYSVAGKTGTAQVALPGGGYGEKTVHTFVGFSPAFDPAFVMLVKLDNPRGVQFSELTAAPVFRAAGEYILQYLGVKPDRPLVTK
ncbi:MAG: penicillin-binding protein 2 [Parcubacteria group bacterium]|nr:penicillin-binding protein 2 [Parcubacteria group bacterium]